MNIKALTNALAKSRQETTRVPATRWQHKELAVIRLRW